MGISTLGALCEDNTKFWLPSMEANGLFFCDIEKGNEIRFVNMFEDSKNNNSWKIQKVIPYNNKIYFFSKYAYKMWELDKGNKEMRQINYFDEANTISNIINVSDDIWIFSQMLKNSIKHMNLNNFEVVELDSDIPSELAESAITKVVKNGTKIYFGTRKENNIHIGVVDCEKNKLTFNLVDKLSFINCIGVVDQYIYILGVDKEQKTILLQYDLKNNKVVGEIFLNKINLNAEILMGYSAMVAFENKLFFIPCVEENIVRYDIDTGEETIIEYPAQFKFNVINNIKFEDIQCEGNVIILFPHSSKQILKLDMSTAHMDVIDIILSEEETDKFLSGILKQNVAIGESENINLCALLRNVQMNKNIIGKKKQNCGEQIFSFVK